MWMLSSANVGSSLEASPSAATDGLSGGPGPLASVPASSTVVGIDSTTTPLFMNIKLAEHEVLANCKACLDACLLHILNLRGFSQTVLVDTWICSLSYVRSSHFLFLLPSWFRLSLLFAPSDAELSLTQSKTEWQVQCSYS